ncbi:MAG: magnesium transporter MgtE N-terminal domain-containing protein [Anaerolineae bacterium]
MAYLSELLGKAVVDIDGNNIGRLKDLVATVHCGVAHPQIVAIVVRRRSGDLFVPFQDVAVLVAPAIALKRRVDDIAPYEPAGNDFCLARDILDKQIIDTNGFRVVRVNDLDLARVNGHAYIANVDIGGLGLLRRLGFGRLAHSLAMRSGHRKPSGVISWESVDLLPGDQTMRLKVPCSRLKDLNPADLAEIITDLSHAESSRLLESLDVKAVADTLEEVEPEFQASLVEGMPDERVADVLEEMAPDEAADLLEELPHERRQELLNLMEQDDAADVRKLLAYPEDSAGGIMNTEFVAIPPGHTAEQAIARIREQAHEAETIYYVYVTESDGRLLGVFSLRDLVLAQPQTPVADFMHRRVIAANLLDSQEDVAQLVAKYNLLAVPVIDENNRLHGIVTADDALDHIIPTAWKKRLPRLYH